MTKLHQGPEFNIDRGDERLVPQNELYRLFCQAEPVEREVGGVDEETGWPYEFWWIGMTRNAKRRHQRRLKVFLKPTPHAIVDQNIPLRGWYKDKVEPKGVRPRPCYSEALLTQPYGGRCPIGCIFCYINNGVRGYRGQPLSVVDPRYPEKIAKQLSKMRTGAAAYISSFTEPFQPLEDYYHNSRRTAEAVDAVGLPMFFLTRRIAPGWAYDILAKNKYSYMQFSITTPDPADWRKLSPRAAALEDMIAQVAEFHKRGIYISIQVDPILPGITTNDQVVELIHILAQAGADALIFKFAECVASSSRNLYDQLERVFGERGREFRRLHSQTIGHVKNIHIDYRRASLDLYSLECKKAGIDMTTCFEFDYKRDLNGDIVDKTGYNMAREYTTCDQCHGQRVPVFSRRSVEDQFEPIPVCPPTGCLYCFETAGPIPPCGNYHLQKATALKPSDYKVPAWTNRHGK